MLDLAAFTYTDSGVQDKSGEDNEAVLYSGRGVNLAGADYVELPDVGATKSITVLVRSSTDTFIYATDDATQTEDAINIITADGTWKEVILTFPNAVSGKIRLGAIGAGPSFFSGDLANARCYDASSALLDQFYLNEHTDVAASGLDGLVVVGRNGNTGQYVNCAAVVQIAGDVGGLTPPQVLGMDFNRYSSVTPTPVLDPNGAILVPESLNKGIDALGNNIEELRSSTTMNADGSGYSVTPDDDSLDLTTEATWVIKGNLYGVPAASSAIITKDEIGGTGNRSWAIWKRSTDLVSEAVVTISENGTTVSVSKFGGLTDNDSVIAVVFDGSGATPADKLKFYVDGSPQTGDFFFGTIPTSIPVTTTPIHIGRWSNASDGLAYSTSDVKIYNRALTAEEVAKFS